MRDKSRAGREPDSKRSSDGKERGIWHLAPLYAGFALTGVGVALPGAILPVLLARWHLSDEGGGRLFLMAWIGSAFGALLVAGSLPRALCSGCIAIAVASVWITLVPASLAPFCMLLYGLGLGTAMTSMSLICQRRARNSGSELVRLNLFWAIGACACPSLTFRTLGTGDVHLVFYPLALLFLLLAAWSVSRLTSDPSAPMFIHQAPQLKSRSGYLRSGSLALSLGIIVLVMLATGVEASAGAWLTSYARRGGDPLSQIIAAPTCLWAGILLSRLLWSFSIHVATELWIVRGSILLMFGSSTLLLLSRHGWPLLLAASLLGFGIGPTYPLLLSRVLRRLPGGTIFFLAGVGSACLSWLTGLVSTQRSSLHSGFLVPATATLLMVALGFALPNTVSDGAVPSNR